MSETVVLEMDCARLVFHPDSGIVHHSFEEPPSGEAFRAVLTQGLKLLEDPAVDKWLSDERYHLDLTPADRDWADEWWHPRAIAAGWKYWAIVMPEHALGIVDMATYISSARRDGIEVAVFYDANRALAWLESLSPQRTKPHGGTQSEPPNAV